MNPRFQERKSGMCLLVLSFIVLYDFLAILKMWEISGNINTEVSDVAFCPCKCWIFIHISCHHKEENCGFTLIYWIVLGDLLGLLGLWDIQRYHVHKQIVLVIVNGTLCCYTNSDEQLLLYQNTSLLAQAEHTATHYHIHFPKSLWLAWRVCILLLCNTDVWKPGEYSAATQMPLHVPFWKIKTFTFCHGKVNFRSLKSFQSCCFFLK